MTLNSKPKLTRSLGSMIPLSIIIILGILIPGINNFTQVQAQSPTSTPYSTPTLRPDNPLNDPIFKSLSQADNLITNGNFEGDYVYMPELGFEPRDNGWIPAGWNWYKSQAYGKYNITKNESFGLVCPDDYRLFTDNSYALSFHMQSTDQPDARLGLYQTVKVTPGQSYVFTFKGVIQAQRGASSPDINNRIEVAFDQTGGSDWAAIPHEKWTLLPWKEQELEFKTSGPKDPDLATVETYYTIVKAKSNKMTVFIDAWRKWPNWRTTIFTLDCVTLAPLNQVDVAALLPRLTELSTTAVDAAVTGSGGATAAVPALTPTAAVAAAAATPAAIQPTVGTVTAVPPSTIPPSGGILDTKRNWILITLVSVVVIVGLVGAGFWNARRKKD